jgi:hypothetical protein
MEYVRCIMGEQEVDGRASTKDTWRKHSSGRNKACIRVRVGEDKRDEIYAIYQKLGLADLVPCGEHRTQSQTSLRHTVISLVTYDYKTTANC